MQREVAVPLTVAAAALITVQAPVNALLAQHVGRFQAALLSFLAGTVALTLAVALLGGGFGSLGADPVRWHYVLGGVLGATFVITNLVAVRVLGAAGLTAAVIAGQLSMSLVVDQLGLLGVPRDPVTVTKLAGVALLAGGATLVLRG